jgi:hypothetical protein
MATTIAAGALPPKVAITIVADLPGADRRRQRPRPLSDASLLLPIARKKDAPLRR